MLSKLSPRNRGGNQQSTTTTDRSFDKKLVYQLRQKKLPSWQQLKHLPKVLNVRERMVFIALVSVIGIATVTGGVFYYMQNFTPVPAPGGVYTEGLIGAPQFINPVLSQTNDVDTDLSRLLFAGLLRYDSNLQLVPDLAEGWTISDDQKEFTFTLKPNLVWHDGEPLTADDVVFTIQSIQDPDFKSPLLVSLRGVQVGKIDDQTVTFTLPESFPEFLEVLTVGILPEHLWGEIPAINSNLTEYNLKPVGAGQWQFKNLIKDRLGNIKSITIIPNPKYPNAKPYLDELTFKFYPNFQTAISALKNRSIDGISFLPKDLKSQVSDQRHLQLYSFNLPQFTAVFFNQNANEELEQKAVREALNAAINKPAILTEALALEGEIIDGPILPGSIGYDPDLEAPAYNPEHANDLLDDAGWTQIAPQEYFDMLAEQEAEAQADAEEEESTEENTEEQADAPTVDPILDGEGLVPPEGGEQDFFRIKDDQLLEITLTTVDQPENVKAAQLIVEFWKAIGVRVHLEIVEANRISREIIKPRDYQALLYGAIVGPESDPYPFWHSSQTQDPGLNLALYANRNADQLLEEVRTTLNTEERHEKLQEFQNIVVAEIPAIFLYSPTYTYAVEQQIKGVGVDRVLVPADRFNNISDWYINTRRAYTGTSN